MTQEQFKCTFIWLHKEASKYETLIDRCDDSVLVKDLEDIYASINCAKSTIIDKMDSRTFSELYNVINL